MVQLDMAIRVTCLNHGTKDELSDNSMRALQTFINLCPTGLTVSSIGGRGQFRDNVYACTWRVHYRHEAAFLSPAERNPDAVLLQFASSKPPNVTLLRSIVTMTAVPSYEIIYGMCCEDCSITSENGNFDFDI